MTTRSPLILAADADPETIELMRNELRRGGMRVLTADSGERALRIAEQQRPDLALLAVSLPGVPGLEVLRRLRASGPLPAILLTERRTVRGLRAAETLTKPFTASDLLARVAEALAESPAQAGGRVTAGSLDIDLDRRMLRRDGEDVPLTRTEWALLAHLARNANRPLAASDILSEVWGPEYRDDLQFLRVWVSRLRAKLRSGAETSEDELTIRTVRGVGYSFEPASAAAAQRARRERMARVPRRSASR